MNGAGVRVGQYHCLERPAERSNASRYLDNTAGTRGKRQSRWKPDIQERCSRDDVCRAGERHAELDGYLKMAARSTHHGGASGVVRQD